MDIQNHLAGLLRDAYMGVSNEAVPQRFAELLAQLDAVFADRQGADASVFKDGLLKAVPNLRAYAISLSGNHARADDLVQETLLKAWQNQHRFEAGTNLHAWLFTILRNLSHSEYRKRTREVEDADGQYSAKLSVAPEQGNRLDIDDLQRALQRLPRDQREALLLVAAEGLTYDEVAVISGCAVGTVKSRVNRARGRLSQMMGRAQDVALAEISA